MSECDRIIEVLQNHAAELKAMGVTRVSVFGSVARGDQNELSDVDLAVELKRDHGMGFREFHDLKMRISTFLNRPIDLIQEPVNLRPHLQAQIDRDRRAAF